MQITKSILKKAYKKRKPQARKGDYGKLLIIGGSKAFTGAPALAGTAALAAYRSGVDLVTIAAPGRAADIIAKFSPDFITYPLEGDCLNKKHVKKLLKLQEGKDAVLIGNGLGNLKSTRDAIIKFLKKTKLPCVIDADAITAVSTKKRILRGKPFVLTPHAAEFKKLSGEDPTKLTLKRKTEAVKNTAKRLGITIVLKGNPDIISDGKRTAFNKTGNAYMTVGGTGDVLAGVIASLLAQGNNPFDSACAGAYITGKAGDIAAKKKKQGLMASDVAQAIPEAL